MMVIVAFSYLNFCSTKANNIECVAVASLYMSSQAESNAAKTGYETAASISAGVAVASVGKTIGVVAAGTGNPIGWGVAAVAFGA